MENKIIDLTKKYGAGNEAEGEKIEEAKLLRAPNRAERRKKLHKLTEAAKIRHRRTNAPVIPIDQTPGANARRKAANGKRP